MKYRIGDEMTPLLRVRIGTRPMRSLVIVSVGPLPDNHPLALALDTLARTGFDQRLDWTLGAIARRVVVTEQAWRDPRNQDAVSVVTWYRDHAKILNRST